MENAEVAGDDDEEDVEGMGECSGDEDEENKDGNDSQGEI